MKIHWATDLHLNHIRDERIRRKLLESILTDADITLLCGDTSTGKCLLNDFSDIHDYAHLIGPTYFVFGNHDFYGISIEQGRILAQDFANWSDFFYLTAMGVVSLTDEVALIGHDGWYDTRNGRVGDVFLNDFLHIKELNAALLIHTLELEIKNLAQEAADHFRKYLLEAFKAHRKVILATHVSPFVESASHGKRSDIKYWPYYSSKVTGDVLLEIMKDNPSKELLVLCGHSHSAGEFQALDNLRVLTGGAEYGQPAFQEVLEI